MHKFIIFLIGIVFAPTILAHPHICQDAEITIENLTAYEMTIADFEANGFSNISLGATIAPRNAFTLTNKLGDNGATITIETFDAQTIKLRARFISSDNADKCITLMPICLNCIETNYSISHSERDGTADEPAREIFSIR